MTASSVPLRPRARAPPRPLHAGFADGSMTTSATAIARGYRGAGRRIRNGRRPARRRPRAASPLVRHAMTAKRSCAVLLAPLRTAVKRARIAPASIRPVTPRRSVGDCRAIPEAVNVTGRRSAGSLRPVATQKARRARTLSRAVAPALSTNGGFSTLRRDDVLTKNKFARRQGSVVSNSSSGTKSSYRRAYDDGSLPSL